MEKFVPLFEEHFGNISQRVEDALGKLEEYMPEFEVADYVVDSETRPDSGRGDEGFNAWIEFLGVDPGVVEGIGTDYDKYHDHFKRWCDENGLYAGQILTGEDDSSVTFEIIVY